MTDTRLSSSMRLAVIKTYSEKLGPHHFPFERNVPLAPVSIN